MECFRIRRSRRATTPRINPYTYNRYLVRINTLSKGMAGGTCTRAGESGRLRTLTTLRFCLMSVCQLDNFNDYHVHRQAGNDSLPVLFTFHEDDLAPANYYDRNLRRWVESKTIYSAGPRSPVVHHLSPVIPTF